MEGQAHWLTGLLVFGGGFATWLALRLISGRRHRELVQRHFYCPRKAKDVDCTMTTSTLTGATIDVVSCSAFDPAERVACLRQCVDDMNAEQRLHQLA